MVLLTPQSDWQLNHKRRSLAFHTFHPERSTMPLRHNVVAQRQPQTRTLSGGFGGEKRLENLGLHCVGNAGAIVADADFDGSAVRTCIHQPGADRNSGLVISRSRFLALLIPAFVEQHATGGQAIYAENGLSRSGQKRQYESSQENYLFHRHRVCSFVIR